MFFGAPCYCFAIRTAAPAMGGLKAAHTPSLTTGPTP